MESTTPQEFTASRIQTSSPSSSCYQILHRSIQWCKVGTMRRLESYFYWHGKMVAKFPLFFIFFCLSVTLTCGLGLFNFREEAEMTALWVPRGAKFRDDFEWVQENFPKQLRINQVIFKSDNVLTAEVVQEMFRLRKQVENLVHDGHRWSDVCLRIPVIRKPKCFDPSKFSLSDFFFGKKRRRRRFTDDWDDWDNVENVTMANVEVEHDECENFQMPDISSLSFSDIARFKSRMETEGFSMALAEDVSRTFYPEPYCHFVQSAATVCMEQSILELWGEDGGYNEDVIANLTDEDVVNTVNSRNKSGVFNIEKNFHDLLSDVSYNSSGHIIGASVTTITWIAKVNLHVLKQFGSVQRGEALDKFTSEFESGMIEVVTDRTEQAGNVTTFAFVAKMFFQALESQAFKDAGMLLVGYLIVFCYVIIMIGKFTFVQQRFFLSLGGILGVVMGIIVSYGVCSTIGFWYSPAHTVIPFLMLGIGIDDMFVIIQCRNTLSEQHQGKGVVERLGKTMEHAGVAITITSITDFIAFGIGATTQLPALRSFCMYASIGILTIFFFQSTWFTALLAIDEYRMERSRDACLCCIVHTSTTHVSSGSHVSASVWTSLFRFVSKILVTIPAKIIVVLVTLSCLAGGIYGTMYLRMEFKPEWLMDPNSEVYHWYEAHKQYFSTEGERGLIYLKDTNYTENLDKIEQLISRLESEDRLIKHIDAWPVKFKEFLSYDNPQFDWSSLDEDMFHEKLSHFLFSPMGAKYRIMFKFEGDLVCGEPAPRVLVSCLDFSHVMYESASQWVPAYDRLNMILEEANVTVIDSTEPAAIPIAVRYSNWVTDKIIQWELYRNIGTSLIAMYVTVLVFLGSFRGAAFVIFCVFGTLVEVAGFMYFMGLTINVITCNTLVISIGLCVDFSAHIAHGFLSRSGSRNERVISTMTEMGPAVFNGGLSTLLAFILLATSKSYVFMSFFKIFFLICIFGLFHGLIALPVLLALLGPIDNTEKNNVEEESNKKEEEIELRRETPGAAVS